MIWWWISWEQLLGAVATLISLAMSESSETYTGIKRDSIEWYTDWLDTSRGKDEASEYGRREQDE